MRQRILIVDDDLRHSQLLATYFDGQGFDSLLAADAIEMQQQREQFHCDLLVLDVNMPGEDGISICRRLRAEGDKTPILILTARNDVVDRILGLEFGSDDYLAKPVNARELVARIRAIFRRLSDSPLNVAEASPVKYSFGPFVLEASSRRLLCNEQLIALTFDEFALLKCLVSCPGQVLSRQQLAYQIRQGGPQIDKRNIDMLVSRVRKRLLAGCSSQCQPTQCQYIQSVRGVGYVFMDDSLGQAES